MTTELVWCGEMRICQYHTHTIGGTTWRRQSVSTKLDSLFFLLLFELEWHTVLIYMYTREEQVEYGTNYYEP